MRTNSQKTKIGGPSVLEIYRWNWPMKASIQKNGGGSILAINKQNKIVNARQQFLNPGGHGDEPARNALR